MHQFACAKKDTLLDSCMYTPLATSLKSCEELRSTHTHLRKNETLKIILNDMNRLIFNWEATSATLHVHPEFVYTLPLNEEYCMFTFGAAKWQKNAHLKETWMEHVLKDVERSLMSLMSGKLFLLQKAGKTLRFWKVNPQSPTNRATQASSWLQPEQPTICGPPCILQPLVLESKASRDAVTLTGWVQPWHSKKSKEPRTKYEHIKGSKKTLKWNPPPCNQATICKPKCVKLSVQGQLCFSRIAFQVTISLIILLMNLPCTLSKKAKQAADYLTMASFHKQSHAFLRGIHHNTRPSTAKGAPRTRLRQAFQSRRTRPDNHRAKPTYFDN